MIEAVRNLGLGLLDHPGSLPDATDAQDLLRRSAAIAVRLWLEGEARRLGADPAGVLAPVPGPLPDPRVLRAAEAALVGEVGHSAPDAMGTAYERLLGCQARIENDAADPRLGFTLTPARGSARRARGAFYTPVFHVEHLLGVCLGPNDHVCAQDRGDPELALLALRVCDPACGSGRFLAGAAARLGGRLARVRHGDGATPAQRCAAVRDVVQHCLFGADIDPVAIDLCRATLWLAGGGLGPPPPADRIAVGDALLGGLPGREGGFDVVVGNPPFLGGLRTATAMGPARSADFERAWGVKVAPYTDAAACFLLLGVCCTRPGGRVTLVQPMSLLAAKDAGPVRAGVLARASLTGLWISGGREFGDASVLTCAPTLEVGGPRRGVLARSVGPAGAALPGIEVDCDTLLGEATWTPLTRGALGVPSVGVVVTGTVGDIARATADFRDQYYGLEGFLVESGDLEPPIDGDRFPAIVTSGLIDAAACRWGTATTRILGRVWRAPRIDRDRMEREGALGAWVRARLVPKVMLATQTRVIEAFVDEGGRFVPSTPVITVTPKDPAMLWHVAAALSSPVVAAWALGRFGGAALSLDAIKLSARQALTAPLPAPGRVWDGAAVLFRDASLEEDPVRRAALLGAFGEAVVAGYGLGGGEAAGILGWWRGRLRKPTRGRESGRSGAIARGGADASPLGASM